MKIEPAEISDQDLLQSARAGDEESFAVLYRRRQSSVYRFALQMSGRRSVAEEVTQEVFLAVIRDTDRFDPQRGSPLAYFYGIARNLTLRCLERDRFYVPIAEEADGDGLQWAAREDTLGDLTRGQTIESVRQAVLALPPNFREVVVLCDLHEMKYEEAARVLGCAVGTVRSRLHRARGMLLEKWKAGRKAFA
jgi:RNA polymerase sigma-70 factor (ECF subfamily)